jgi:hypothetical protein
MQFFHGKSESLWKMKTMLVKISLHIVLLSRTYKANREYPNQLHREMLDVAGHDRIGRRGSDAC